MTMLLFFALICFTSAIVINENDVRCDSDGNIYVTTSGFEDAASRMYAFGENGPCRRRFAREDVVHFERHGDQGSPFRLIIDVPTVGIQVLDIRCIGDGASLNGKEILSGGVLDRIRDLMMSASQFLNNFVPSEYVDQQRNVTRRAAEEVKDTGLDKDGNLVKDRDFSVAVGMSVNVPLSDNDEIEIDCVEPGRIALSNPDPKKFRYALAYTRGGDLCVVKIRAGFSRLAITACNTKKPIKVAFNDQEFSQGILGGSGELKVYQIDCKKIMAEKGLDDTEPGVKSTKNDYEYYYIDEEYDYYDSSGHVQTCFWQLIGLVSIFFFLEWNAL